MGRHNTASFVGKPTLVAKRNEPLAKIFESPRIVASAVDNRRCQVESVTGTDHCRDRLFALLAIDCGDGCKRSEPPPPGATQGRVKRFVFSQPECIRAIVLRHAG